MLLDIKNKEKLSFVISIIYKISILFILYSALDIYKANTRYYYKSHNIRVDKLTGNLERLNRTDGWHIYIVGEPNI